MSSQGQQLVHQADKYLGIQESWGSNWGPTVKHLQSSTGAYRLPWCASAIVKWCDEVGIHLRYRSANARAVVVNNGVSVSWDDVQAGDLVFFNIGAGHCGVARGPTRGNYIDTVDGNTSSTVAHRTRHRSAVGAIHRVAATAPRPKPKPKPKLPWIEMATSENGKRKVHWRGPQEKAKRLLPIWIKRRKNFSIRRGALPKKGAKK